jgi:SAM-dependent methyltransferase
MLRTPSPLGAVMIGTPRRTGTPAPASSVVAWSAPATTRRVLELLELLDWTTARVADVGAGAGYLSDALSRMLLARGLDPAERVFACDLMPESFACRTVSCAALAPDGTLPFADESFDAVVAVEVVEHVEDQFAFLREMARIAKPGGLVVLTTPNVLNANSRLRTLFSGFPVLYDPLPLDVHDPRHLGGHIHPVTPYYLAYAAIRAGLLEPTFHPDRTKKSAVVLTILLAPLFLAGSVFLRMRLRRKEPSTLEENRGLLDSVLGWKMLTCRTAVLRAVKPGRVAPGVSPLDGSGDGRA